MSLISVRLTCLLPRWALSSDPHVRVNASPPRPLTKTPVEFEVASGDYVVEVTSWRPGTFGSADRPSFTGRGAAGVIDDGEHIAFRFHPAYSQSWLHKGHLRRETAQAVEALT